MPGPSTGRHDSPLSEDEYRSLDHSVLKTQLLPQMSMFRNANTMYDREFFSDVDAGSLPSARVVVPMVVELVHPRSVIDVGCARGAWLRAFEESGVDDVLGVDGDYVDCDALWIDREKFVACDLPSPLGVRRVFDLALCLEVAEHLSARKGKDLIRMLCSLAPAVLFSAAVPGQGGTNHVNEQWPGYWSNLFSRQGFVRLDPIRRRIFQNPVRVFVLPAKHVLVLIGTPDREFFASSRGTAASDRELHRGNSQPGAQRVHHRARPAASSVGRCKTERSATVLGIILPA